MKKHIKKDRHTPNPLEAGTTKTAILNGLKFTFDGVTGGLLGLHYAGPGQLLKTTSDQSGMIDLAYPIPEFQPLRLASRFSCGARIDQTGDAVVISWKNLGASRPYFSALGKVSAKVWIQALPDKRSISMKCRIVNASTRSIGQVLFPDFRGFLPFAGREDTCFRTTGFVRQPFVDMGATTYPEFYARDKPSDTREVADFYGGFDYGEADSMIGRWMDFGGLNGGLSLFPKVWGDAPQTKIQLQRLEKDPNIRVIHRHDNEIKPGVTWVSPEYILTPHRHGWAKGIEPYREYVNAKLVRPYPMPKHILEGIGFRTIFMCKGYPADGDRDVAFKARDLPRIAKEAKAHGINELMLWFWQEPFQLPTPPPYSHLGTPEEFTNAIKECKNMGVNVAMFISIQSLAEPTASRYGFKLDTGWTYHPELVPRFNPPYANGRGAHTLRTCADPAFKDWRSDASMSLRKIHNQYSPSICWDQATPEMEDIYWEYLSWARPRDPHLTFSGEIIGSSEKSAAFLDYTWNWEGGSFRSNLMKPYRDDRAFTASFASPRLNKNVNRNAAHIKYYFMDNSYINAMPSAIDDANGTALITSYKDVSRTLKDCARLRHQFLSYFTEGKLIGDSLLQEPSPEAHINAYVLPDRVLLIILNTTEGNCAINVKIDLAPWLSSLHRNYELIWYDQGGNRVGTKINVKSKWAGNSGKLEKFEMALLEFIAI